MNGMLAIQAKCLHFKDTVNSLSVESYAYQDSSRSITEDDTLGWTLMMIPMRSGK